MASFFMPERKSVAEELDEQVLRVKQLPSPNSCIFKVPQVLRVHDEAAYKPKIIAIGPYNRMDKNLHSMEDHKIRYFKALLDRRPFIRSSDLVAAVEEVKFQAAECYHDICSASDDFVKTMVLDGCFILELLVRHADEVASAYKKDPIFSSTWILCSLQHDLILLENQIPYIVLLKLYSLTIAKYRKAQASDELNKLVVCFFQSMLPCLGETDSRTQQQPRHILDLLRINLLPKTTRTVEEVDSPSYELPRCISDLKEAGVCLKKRQVSDGVLDIQFNNGYLEIPSFYIDENTDVLLRNMIAFEQCDGKSTHEITSYGLLLQNLMNSEKDVKILSDEGIINTLGNNKELALKINSMCKGVCIVSFCYEGLCRECNLYASQYWPRKRTTLAGICCLVLLLTILHTFYAILAYQ